MKNKYFYLLYINFFLFSSCSSVSGFLSGNISFSSVAEKVLPSVVHVRVVDQKTQLTPEGWDFSYNPFTPSPGNIFEEKKEFFEEGLGSGVIIRQEGERFFAVTNKHVIADADKITVKLFDGEFAEAFIAGVDERKDIAVIYFDTKNSNIKVISKGNSDKLRVGDWVLAVGSPFGFDSSVTSGIVSGLGRQNSTGGNISDFIQTDASINTGNSGGALVNTKGKLVGINSWITTTTGGSIGLGFAIPVNNIIKSVDDLINFGEVKYGWIGVIAGYLPDYEKEIFEVSDKKGIMIFQTIKEGPADINGLLPGDFIIKVNNRETLNVDSLLLAVGEAEEGSEADFLIIREGITIVKKLKPGLRDNKSILAEKEHTYWPGITVITLNKKYIDIKVLENIDNGVIVSYVEKGAVFDSLSAGDIIIEINGKEIKNTRDFYREISTDKDKTTVKYYHENKEYVKVFEYTGKAK
ncbi:MAG: trypsin-like peptidase domain-containing protein [Spirochaetia bacterium]|nr:trypsin-like peptidase domain-containing protein [Spirochaetia bacterium]